MPNPSPAESAYDDVILWDNPTSGTITLLTDFPADPPGKN